MERADFRLLKEPTSEITLGHCLRKLVTSQIGSDKAEMFNAAFASDFNTNDRPWDA